MARSANGKRSLGGPNGGAPKGEALAQTPRARVRVLLVEDDPDSRELFRELLSTRFDVVSAESAEQALSLAETEHPDVVLADVLLPHMDGLGLLDALQGAPATQELPVVLLSARREEGLVVACLEHGAADFIAKPPGCRELLARIDRAVRERRRRGQLEALARTDGLTGLFNFRALAERLEEEVQRAIRYDHSVSVVMIDLDHLKELNDRLGHSAGNRALSAVGRLLNADLRQADFAARYGGDEFIVLLPHQEPSDAERFAERLRTRLRAVRVTDERGILELPLTASMGVAGLSAAWRFEGGEALLRAADLALYEAKRRGRNQVALYGREVAAGEASPHPSH